MSCAFLVLEVKVDIDKGPRKWQLVLRLVNEQIDIFPALVDNIVRNVLAVLHLSIKEILLKNIDKQRQMVHEVQTVE